MNTPDDRGTQPMNPSPDVESIFHHARGIADANERSAYLAKACGSDAALRARVDALLAAGADMGQFLASRNPAERPTEPDALDRVGTRLDKYKLLQLIGEGGFGTVYLAEQDQPVRRRVALKIIKPGMDSRMVAARFEAERQALALMDHPHIARVIDGGITDPALGSRPYFVMEYVVGDPITTFADAHRLSIHDRLNLFAQVCSAVQHAHTKGIIHRDLKPGNVLVSMVDGKPFAKVIDFGIAKSLASRLTEKTLFTEHRQLIGTPEYMSPEQAEGSPDIDTRADVYALGVLLYELLAGVTPFDGSRLRSAAFAEMQRIIRDEEPPAPSLRLSRGLETLASTAAARQVEPARLSGMVKGELDWIVMKALDKDRARRYETANQLAADVRRHLAGEAVVAAPASAAYRLRKIVKKNKGPATAVSAVMLALAAGGSLAAWGMWQARIESEINMNNSQSLEDAFKGVLFRSLGGDDNNQPFAGIGARIVSGDGREYSWWLKTDDTGDSRNWRLVVDAPPGEGGSMKAVHLAMAEMASSAIEGLRTRTADLEAANVALAQQRDAAKEAMNRVLVDGLGYPGAGIVSVTEEGSEQDVTFEQSIASLENIAIEKIKAEREQTEAAEWSAYTANLALAQGAINAHDYPEARRIASRWNQGKAGWEARFLDREARAISVAIPGSVWGSATLRDSNDLCVMSYDGKTERCVSIGDGHVRDTSELSPAARISAIIGRDPMWIKPVAEDIPQVLTTFMPIERFIDRVIPKSGHSTYVTPAAFRLRYSHDHRYLLVVDTRTYGLESAVLVNLATGLPIRRVGNLGTYFAACDVADDGHWLISLAHGVAGGAADARVTVFDLSQASWPEVDLHNTSASDGRSPSDVDLAVGAILASSPNGPSGLTLTTPDGTRRIIGGADKTIRFYESKDGKPTMPATADSPEGVYRDVAVFRMPEAVTNLQMTGDGLRLIIHLADGSARVWDIRDPDERRKDLQAEWAERVPAGEYLDSLWNATNADGSLSISDNHLRDAVINDASLTPLRRLVAVEMLEERLEDDRLAAEQAFAAITKGQTERAAVRAAAAIAELPARVRIRVLAAAENWEYVELEDLRGATDAVAASKSREVQPGDNEARVRGAYLARLAFFGRNHILTAEARAELARARGLGEQSGEYRLAMSEWQYREGLFDSALSWVGNMENDPRAFALVSLNLLALSAAEIPTDEERDEHHAAARSALAKARALMAPTTNPDGTITPSPWADDPDAKALLAEAEALIEAPAPPK